MLKPLVLICSVDREAGPVVSRLTDPAHETIGRRRAVRGILGGTPVTVLVGGMGKTNASQALTAYLERETAGAVIGFGIAGAYGERPAVGEIAIATSEIYADEGVETPAGWGSTREIGIPLAVIDGTPIYNEFSTDPRLVAAARGALEHASVPHSTGAFTTVSACSGTARLGQTLRERHHAICETMEGAAYAHVAALYGAPYLEIRGVSNIVTDRDPATWRIDDAASATARALEIIAPTIEHG